MDGGEEVGGVVGCLEFSAMLGELEGFSEEGLGGRGSEADDDLGLKQLEFFKKPGTTGDDFGPAWFGVEPLFAAAFLPFEVLDGVGDVDGCAVDFGGNEGFIEDPSGGADEGFAGTVFLVAGLFADEDDFGGGGALAEDGLGGVAVEGAAVAFLHGFGEGGEGDFFGQEVGRGAGGAAGFCGDDGHPQAPAKL